MDESVTDFPLIDFVISVSEGWRVQYVENCCASILRQEYPRDRICVTMVHTSCDGRDNDVAQYAELCRKIGSRLVFLHQNDPMYNKSKSQNAGARSGFGKFIAFVDCDIVLYTRVLKYAIPHLARGDATVIPVKRTNFNPQDDEIRRIATGLVDDVEWDRISHDESGFRRDANGCIIVQRETFFEISGYNEQLYGWGADDTDFAIRVKRNLQSKGLDLYYLFDEGCRMSFHQSHPSRRSDEIEGTKRNRGIYKKPLKDYNKDKPWGLVRVQPNLMEIQDESFYNRS